MHGHVLLSRQGVFSQGSTCERIIIVITVKSYVFVTFSVVKYNEEKEEQAKQERKQRQLEAVELARQLEEEKKKNGMILC